MERLRTAQYTVNLNHEKELQTHKLAVSELLLHSVTARWLQSLLKASFMTSSEPNRASKAPDSSVHTRTSVPSAFSTTVLSGAAAENHLRFVRFRCAATALCPGPRSGPGSGSLS